MIVVFVLRSVSALSMDTSIIAVHLFGMGQRVARGRLVAVLVLRLRLRLLHYDAAAEPTRAHRPRVELLRGTMRD